MPEASRSLKAQAAALFVAGEPEAVNFLAPLNAGSAIARPIDAHRSSRPAPPSKKLFPRPRLGRM